MASGTINRPAYSRVIIPTLVDATNWEIVQSNIREASGSVVGSIILKCKNSVSMAGDIVSTGLTLPAYAFLVGMVSASQWDYVPTRFVRVYFKTSGIVSIGTSFTAGEYLTIGFNVGSDV